MVALADAKPIAPGLYALTMPDMRPDRAQELIEMWRGQMGPDARLVVLGGGAKIERVSGPNVATLTADIPSEDLHAGDKVMLLGPVVVGSTVHFAYQRADGTVPSLPIPASALRMEVLE